VVGGGGAAGGCLTSAHGRHGVDQPAARPAHHLVQDLPEALTAGLPRPGAGPSPAGHLCRVRPGRAAGRTTAGGRHRWRGRPPASRPSAEVPSRALRDPGRGTPVAPAGPGRPGAGPRGDGRAGRAVRPRGGRGAPVRAARALSVTGTPGRGDTPTAGVTRAGRSLDALPVSLTRGG